MGPSLHIVYFLVSGSQLRICVDSCCELCFALVWGLFLSSTQLFSEGSRVTANQHRVEYSPNWRGKTVKTAPEMNPEMVS